MFRRNRNLDPSNWLVVGLGNPGPGYSVTRHNLGRMALQKWVEDLPEPPKKLKNYGYVWTYDLGQNSNPKIFIVTLSSFMNRSGSPLRSIMSFYKVAAAKLIVVHDDLDLNFGAIRLKFGGGAGGHNGVRDIIQALGTNEFFRVRAGVGRPNGSISAADYVLQEFSDEQASELSNLLTRIVEASECLIQEGLLSAQQRIH